MPRRPRKPGVFESVPMGSYYIAIGEDEACMLLKRRTQTGDGDQFFNCWREPFFGGGKRSAGRWSAVNEGATFLAISSAEVAGLYAYVQLLPERATNWGDYVNTLIANEKEPTE